MATARAAASWPIVSSVRFGCWGRAKQKGDSLGLDPEMPAIAVMENSSAGSLRGWRATSHAGRACRLKGRKGWGRDSRGVFYPNRRTPFGIILVTGCHEGYTAANINEPMAQREAVVMWIEKIEQGDYELILTTLELKAGDASTYKGNGTVSWTRAKGSEIRATTDGGIMPFHHWASTMPAMGQLFDAGHFLALQAKTREGDNVSIGRMHPGAWNVSTQHEPVFWRFRDGDLLSPIVIEQEHGGGHAKCSSLLLKTRLKGIWPLETNTTNDNECFPLDKSEKDWVKYECSLGIVAAQAREHNTLVQISGGEAIEDGRLVDAICLAFSFMTGRMVNAVALQRHHDGKQTNVLYRPWAAPRNNHLHLPLHDEPALWGNIPAMLASLTDFFLTEESKEISTLLYACLDAADNTFTTRALVLSAAVEGVARCLGIKSEAREGDAESKLDERIDAVAKCLEEGGLASWTRRVSGFLRSRIKRPTANDVLHQWAKKALIGITHEEIECWKAVRHPTAHGDALIGHSRQQVQENSTNFTRVNNLLNKLILQVSGYKGKFYDYAKWDKSDFPAEEAANLFFNAGPKEDGSKEP